MLHLLRKSEADLTVVSPAKPRPRLVEVGAEPLGVYEELAEDLDFCPAQLLEEQLKRFLGESNIPIYDYGEVDQYMAVLAEEQKMAWIWRPLRKCDRPNTGWNGRETQGTTEYDGHGSYHDLKRYRPYDKAVPAHILRHVKKIQDKFGDNVKFFVSDYAVPNPDPFIMVTAEDVEKIVFGVWDEPGFGDSEEG